MLFGGCINAELKENKLFKDKDACEKFADEQVELLIFQMEQQGIIGDVRYGCVEYDQKKQRI